jgi:hypothetical protein
MFFQIVAAIGRMICDTKGAEWQKVLQGVALQ